MFELDRLTLLLHIGALDVPVDEKELSERRGTPPPGDASSSSRTDSKAASRWRSAAKKAVMTHSRDGADTPAAERYNTFFGVWKKRRRLRRSAALSETLMHEVFVWLKADSPSAEAVCTAYCVWCRV